ncbi:copper chaperone PCu(A)C [Sphingorhabdus sp. IMCC26285]|jgi:copper(I)-binding protein|uniref:Copper chaperone PCu(A)C n=1 Tax=Sphingorhabdus profundilacus TaxID=2509718 RepID=A0A6I4LZY9_9SPHN|nr:copper chaperone PCu(A)C [Sphingorhabdus profundilacus]MVZ97504.1 copper chaperone PCu(A)C [Sphingorhabdus profundilacus]
MDRRVFTLGTAAMALLLGSCGPTPQLKVKEAVLTLSPVDSNPSSYHFNVYGGPQDVYLLRVSTPSAIRTEMHDVSVDPKTGAVSMSPMQRVLIPSGKKVEFKRGGKHVMMWGVNLIPRRLGEIETEFLFSNNERILVKARVQEMDGTDPDEKKALN